MPVVLIDAATRREGHRAHSGCELFNTEIHETAASAVGELALERTQRSPECSQGTPINKSEHVGPSPRPSAQPPERLSTEKGALLVVWGRLAGRCDHESPTTRMSTTTLEDLYPRGGPRHRDATAPAVRVGDVSPAAAAPAEPEARSRPTPAAPRARQLPLHAAPRNRRRAAAPATRARCQGLAYVPVPLLPEGQPEENGEGGIRTRDRGFPPYSLSRRVPSATRPPLP
jgi:hypothetical protein